jgi:FlaA1/EpsC-like NDP-sugar epimerase
MSTSKALGWRRFLPVPLDETRDLFASAHTGQSVLVTGAGGFIGSALVKAISHADPGCIILVDSSEQNLFEIERYLKSSTAHVLHSAVLGTVEDRNLLDDIFSRFHPEIVYHAAAFKHVPLLEQNPFAGVRNNTLGTYVLAQAAVRHGASKFVLVSTDKAVNPHSILGVSKRIAELIVVAMSSPECRMNAIRLGNVIGSPGSVVPVFLKQIAESGPVTVTHPEASRWFLSLRDAVQAILCCGRATCACEGRVLLPDLGEPVRIAELAAFLIHAARNGSSNEIPIVFTGLRPGDRLTEELASQAEIKEGFVEGLQVMKTRKLAPVELDDIMAHLSSRVHENPRRGHDLSGLIHDLCSAVPEYIPSELLR